MLGIDALTDHPRRLRSRTPRLRLALAIVATAGLAAPTASHANPIDVAFSNASTVINGTPESITGIFSVDYPFSTELFAHITLTDPAGNAVAYSCGNCGVFTPFADNTIVAGGLQITFANSDFLRSDPLASVKINGVTYAATGVSVPTGGPPSYTFSNASTVLNGLSESIVGSFVFDSFGDFQSATNITLIGPPPYGSGYFFDLENLPPNCIRANGGAPPRVCYC